METWDTLMTQIEVNLDRIKAKTAHVNTEKVTIHSIKQLETMIVILERQGHLTPYIEVCFRDSNFF
jgi:hypothetical protein